MLEMAGILRRREKSRIRRGPGTQGPRQQWNATPPGNDPVLQSKRSPPRAEAACCPLDLPPRPCRAKRWATAAQACSADQRPQSAGRALQLADGAVAVVTVHPSPASRISRQNLEFGILCATCGSRRRCRLRRRRLSAHAGPGAARPYSLFCGRAQYLKLKCGSFVLAAEGWLERSRCVSLRSR